MWLLTFLPTGFLEFIVNAVLILGIILTVLSFFVLNRLLLLFPPLASYYRIIQVVSLVILCAGIYFKGGYSVEKMWRDRVEELESKIRESEVAAAAATRNIEAQVVEKTQVVREKGETIIKYVDRWKTKEIIKEVPGPERVRVEQIVQYIENCPVPPELVDLHNQAAILNQAAGSSKTESKK
jgi:hypothetical protein